MPAASRGWKFSWQVTARRNDAYMRAHPMVVGQEKPEGQHGRYLSPELFEMGMFCGGKVEKPSPDLIKSPRHHPNLPQLLQTRKN